MYIPITDFMRKTRRKIMKKRFMTGVVAAVTALAMSVSALAAGSIVALLICRMQVLIKERFH